MYTAFFGLSQRPFELTTDLSFLFLSDSHREALSNLRYGIAAPKGLTVLTGEAGTGKSTIIRAALSYHQNPNARIVYVNNPLLSRQEFFELLIAGFGLGPGRGSKTHVLLELTRTLTDHRVANRVTALVIDEAQSLPHDLMEEVRLLANIDTSGEPLLPVILVGQPELANRLNQRELRQLKQRIALRCVIEPLTFEDTTRYIATRVNVAGGDVTRLFTDEAVELIFHRSRGIPRVISVICDNALVAGFAANQRPVGKGLVLEICHDFDLVPPGPVGGVWAGASGEAEAASASAAVPPRAARPPTLVAEDARTDNSPVPAQAEAEAAKTLEHALARARTQVDDEVAREVAKASALAERQHRRDVARIKAEAAIERAAAIRDARLAGRTEATKACAAELARVRAAISVHTRRGRGGAAPPGDSQPVESTIAAPPPASAHEATVRPPSPEGQVLDADLTHGHRVDAALGALPPVIPF